MPRPIISQIRLKQGDTDFLLLRKKVRNTTIRIKNGEVVVTAPVSQSETRVKEIVAKHDRWIKTHLLKHAEKQGKVFLYGNAYERVDEYALRASVTVADGVCTVRGKDEMHREKALLAFYKREIEKILPAYFDKWQKVTGLYAKSVTVTNAKTYLGRCNVNDRTIKISCRLAAKPLCVIDYVVLHELCHIRYAGHRKNFYALVSKYMPDYKLRIKIMRGR